MGMGKGDTSINPLIFGFQLLVLWGFIKLPRTQMGPFVLIGVWACFEGLTFKNKPVTRALGTPILFFFGGANQT